MRSYASLTGQALQSLLGIRNAKCKQLSCESAEALEISCLAAYIYIIMHARNNYAPLCIILKLF